jgi:Domain of unknown function DUF29
MERADRVGERGRGDREPGALASHIAIIIEHLLKLQGSPAQEPARGWRDTIRRARREIERLLKDSPSLRREVASVVADETGPARALVRANLEDCGEQPLTDICGIVYSEAQVFGDWLPAPV